MSPSDDETCTYVICKFNQENMKCVIVVLAQIQDIQMKELFHVLEILESFISKDSILASYDVIDDDITGHFDHEIITR